MACNNCANWNGGLVCIGCCGPEKVMNMSQLEKRRFKLWYRLNTLCDWQPAMPLASNLEEARLALLLAVKTIYRIGSKDIQIVEKLGEEPIVEREVTPLDEEIYPYGIGPGDFCGF